MRFAPQPLRTAEQTKYPSGTSAATALQNNFLFADQPPNDERIPGF